MYGKSSKKKIIKYEEGWAEAEPRIQAFLDRIEGLDPNSPTLKRPKVPKEEFSTVYHQIFEMCNQKDPHNLSEQLYHAFIKTLDDYFRSKCIPDLERAVKEGGHQMLKTWAWRWWVGCRVIEQMKRFFRFLDRYYIKSQDTLQPLLQTGYQKYNDTVYHRFKNALPDVIFSMITNEREGVEIDRELMRNTIDSFVNMGQHLAQPEATEEQKLEIYVDLFERDFINKTRVWYQQKTQEWKNESTPAYLKIAETQYVSEEDRLIAYVHKSTYDRLKETVLQELLMKHQDELLDKPTGLDRMFMRSSGLEKTEALRDLERLSDLYSRIKGDAGIKPIANRMKDYIAKVGDKYVNSAKQAEGSKGGSSADKQRELIQQMLTLHTQFNDIVQKQFHNHPLCVKALRDGFKTFINREEYVATRLAIYAHSCLKRGASPVTEDLMDNIVKLYEYINDKDFFELHYQRLLAERLINDTSASYDNEKTMISKLKMEGGNATWSKKLEEMFQDLQTSQNILRDFNREYTDMNIDFDCRICTFGQWPYSGFDIVEMPPEVKNVTDAFAKFYAKNFNGRCLEYRLDKGKATVIVPLIQKDKSKAPQVKEFIVSPFQMIILLKFNKKVIWKYTELQKETGIKNTDENFDRALLSLAHPKLKVLEKRPNKKELKPDDAFRINNKFKSPQRRVVVPPYAGSIGRRDKENEEERRQVLKLREHQADAAIVRTMKSRKEMDHNSLQQEVIRQLATHFTAQATFIKKRIAILIDQEYIKRSRTNRTRYVYIA